MWWFGGGICAAVITVFNCDSLVGVDTHTWGRFLGGGGWLGAGVVGLTAGVICVLD